MKKVAVVGAAQTRFGEQWSKSLRDLSVEAGKLALEDSDLHGTEIQALYIGNMSAGRFIGQEHLSALAADQAGLIPIPATRCEAACASGALAFRQAYLAIASGKYDIVMAAGAEKMTDLKTTDVTTSLIGAGDQEWEAGIGMTFPALYALMARAHMHKYGTTQEQLAKVAVINHKNAVGNKNAQYQAAITVNDVLKSPIVASPLHLLDCSPITDGAACLILASDKLAKKFSAPVWILSSEQASDTIALHDRASLTELAATKHAAKLAYNTAGLKPCDINVAEVHDCFTINEILSLEDLGFCKKGSGGSFVENGGVDLNGEIPTNTTGGLKAIGHPVGATGIRQIVDIVKQLRGVSHNQIKGVETGLTMNVVGSGASAAVNIFSREMK